MGVGCDGGMIFMGLFLCHFSWDGFHRTINCSVCWKYWMDDNVWKEKVLGDCGSQLLREIKLHGKTHCTECAWQFRVRGICRIEIGVVCVHLCV